MRSIYENHTGVHHPVVYRFVQDVLEDLVCQLWWKSFVECIAYRRKMGYVVQEVIPQKPPVCHIDLYLPPCLPQ